MYKDSTVKLQNSKKKRYYRQPEKEDKLSKNEELIQ